jgi:hypothetical protein
VVVLGVDEENLAAMRSHQPVHVNLGQLEQAGPVEELPDVDVVVFYIDPESSVLLRREAKRCGGELHVVEER